MDSASLPRLAPLFFSPTMDADLWAARLSAAKRQQQTQHQWDRLSIDDFETDDEVRPEFACPYCYEDLTFRLFVLIWRRSTYSNPKGWSAQFASVP